MEDKEKENESSQQEYKSQNSEKNHTDYILSFLKEHPDYQSILPSLPEELIQKNILVDSQTFQIGEQIGEGSQGAVFRAKIPENNPLYTAFKAS